MKIEAKDIKDWLDQQSDFTLEMKAFACASSLGYEAEHGGTYSDSITNLNRQFDIRAIIRHDCCSIRLAIECKALSLGFPLVIQRAPRTDKESYHDVMYAHKPETDMFGIQSSLDNSRIMRTNSGSLLYPQGQPVGKACNQIGRKNNKLFANDKDVYEKWSQAILSAHDLTSDAVYDREKLGLDNFFSTIFPVLVVSDECLWSVDYSATGERIGEPAQVDNVAFFIGKQYWRRGQMHAAYTVSHLTIATFTGYKSLMTEIASNTDFWAEVFSQNNLPERT